jgi:hypothetical protein
VLGDDCVVIDRVGEVFIAPPSHPAIRLWADSAGALFENEVEGSIFAHHSNKRKYSQGLTFATRSAPVLAVAALNRGPDRESKPILVDELHGHPACAEVLHGVRFLPDGRVRRSVAADILDLSSKVRVGRLNLPSDLDQLQVAQAALVEWFDG